MKTHPHSTADLRRINRNRVYRCLYESRKPKSKQELARELAMSLPTLTQYLDELLKEGLIDNSEVMDSTGGRRPHALSVVPDARYAVGVELSSGHIRMAAVDLRVCILGTRIIKREFSPDAAYAGELASAIEGFLEERGLSRSSLLGVGVTVPGIVDNARGVITNAHTLRVQQTETGVLISRIPYPVQLSNDANAGGFAEWWSRTGAKDMAYLSLSRGVGGALLLNGVSCLGTHARSGEFGHMCIHPDGEQCGCGRRGCLEVYCTTSRLAEQLDMTLEEFFEGLRAGNRRLGQLWDAYLEDLAVGVANIHTMLDCEVVLGGKLSQFMAERLDELGGRLERLDPNYREEPYLSICRYHAEGNRIGAALYYIDRFIRQI